MVEMGCSVFFQGLTQPLGASYAGSRFGADAEAWDIKVKVVLQAGTFALNYRAVTVDFHTLNL